MVRLRDDGGPPGGETPDGPESQTPRIETAEEREMQATLARFTKRIKLRVEVEADRPCSTRGCRLPAPAPGPRKCRYCRALESVERVLRRAADADDGRLIDVIAEAVQRIEADAVLWTTPAYRAVIGLGVDRATTMYFRSGAKIDEAVAVRRVRDPIIDPDPDDDFWGLDRLAEEEARASISRFHEARDGSDDPNGPSAASVEAAEYNRYMTFEL